MLNTPTSASYFDPPASQKATFRFGGRSRWQGESVREVVLTLGDAKVGLPISFFIDPKASRLVGYEWKRQGILGWAHYARQQFNPKLPENLGVAPSGQSSLPQK
jgi:hypothetical protein